MVSQEFRLQGAMSLHPTSACFPAGTELIEFEFRTDFPNLIESQEAVGFNYIQVMSSRPGRFVINTVVIAKPFDKRSYSTLPVIFSFSVFDRNLVFSYKIQS